MLVDVNVTDAGVTKTLQTIVSIVEKAIPRSYDNISDITMTQGDSVLVKPIVHGLKPNEKLYYYVTIKGEHTVPTITYGEESFQLVKLDMSTDTVTDLPAGEYTMQVDAFADINSTTQSDLLNRQTVTLTVEPDLGTAGYAIVTNPLPVLRGVAPLPGQRSEPDQVIEKISVYPNVTGNTWTYSFVNKADIGVLGYSMWFSVPNYYLYDITSLEHRDLHFQIKAELTTAATPSEKGTEILTDITIENGDENWVVAPNYLLPLDWIPLNRSHKGKTPQSIVDANELSTISPETGYVLITIIDDLQDRVRDIKRRLVGVDECNDKWWEHTSADDNCLSYYDSRESPGSSHVCHFCVEFGSDLTAVNEILPAGADFVNFSGDLPLSNAVSREYSAGIMNNYVYRRNHPMPFPTTTPTIHH